MDTNYVHFKNNDPPDTNLSTSASDLIIVTNNHETRKAHKIILAKFSSLLAGLMSDKDDGYLEDDCCLIIPDIASSHLDLILQLAYSGSVRHVSRTDIGAISDICNLFRVKLDQFVVRAEKLEQQVPVSEDDSHPVDDESSADNLDDDEEMSHENNSFQCQYCQKTFSYAKSYERHIEVCKLKQETKVENGDAKTVTKTDETTKTVFKFEHYEVQDDFYFCRFPGCDYQESFKTIGGCKNHQLKYHARDDEKNFLCQFCDEKFASNQLRNKHQNLAHTKRFSCDQCDMVFSEKSRLQVHYRIHSGERPYVCEDCGFSCTQKDNLRIHKEFKHPKTGKQEKRFKCNICSTTFLTQGNLKRHELTHTKLKEFVCETCGKCFRDPGTLRQHTFSHGTPDYACDICDQKFTSPLYLNRHIVRVHPTDGVQPLTCGICHKGFSLKHQLEEHIEYVHENKKHRCPQCFLLIGRRSSVARHIKKGRCRAFENLPQISAIN